MRIRPIRQRDSSAWWEIRRRNTQWLTPWDSTVPAIDERPVMSFRQMVWSLRSQARSGRTMPFAIDINGQLAGQLTVSSIVYGSARWASLGYWIDRDKAGRGYVPIAVALACDHLFRHARLHRIEIAIRPENEASLRIVEKLNFTEVGFAPGYLHIAGEWADHRIFQLLADDRPRGVLATYLAEQL